MGNSIRTVKICLGSGYSVRTGSGHSTTVPVEFERGTSVYDSFRRCRSIALFSTFE